MLREMSARLVDVLPGLVWALLAVWLVIGLRRQLPIVLARITGVEAFGVKLALAGSQALASAIEFGRKNRAWDVEVPAGDRDRALERANRERAVLDGAEVLWVDDRPSNNRNEARMLRSFGVMITFACTTDEAVAAIGDAAAEARPFHCILSDISRTIPVRNDEAGLAMLARFAAEKITQPVIFYVGVAKPEAGTPAGAFGLTRRPDLLLQLLLDVLERVRGPRS